jgi:hypothetical protein
LPRAALGKDRENEEPRVIAPTHQCVVIEFEGHGFVRTATRNVIALTHQCGEAMTFASGTEASIFIERNAPLVIAWLGGCRLRHLRPSVSLAAHHHTVRFAPKVPKSKT